LQALISITLLFIPEIIDNSLSQRSFEMRTYGLMSVDRYYGSLLLLLDHAASEQFIYAEHRESFFHVLNRVNASTRLHP